MFRSLRRLFPTPAARRSPARRSQSFRPLLEALGTALAGGPAARRPGPARPALEALEARQVPAALSAVSYFNGDDAFVALAAIDSGTHHALLYTRDITYGTQFYRQSLGGPTVTDVSLGYDQTAPDPISHMYTTTLHLFVRAPDQTTTAFTNGVATPLYGGVTELSATQGTGRVFGLGGGGRVYVNTWYGSGWTQLGGYAQHISAGHDASGNDVVFAIGGGAIYAHDASYDPMGWRWSLVDNSAYFTQLSAGPNGHVFAVDSAGALHETSLVHILRFWLWMDANLGRSPGGYAVTALSAASYYSGYYNDAVFVIDASGTAYQYTPSGWRSRSVDTYVREITGATGDLFFDVNYQIPWYWNGSSWIAASWTDSVV
jgi:hypothetical protein